MGQVSCRLPDGQLLRLHGKGEYTSTRLYWYGVQGYEPESLIPFYQLAGSALTIFDVGAHVGVYTLVGALANPSAQVFAFEPHPKAHRQLRDNIALNRLTNVETFEIALSDGEEQLPLYHSPEGLPTGSTLSSEHGREAGTALLVNRTTLDSLVRRRQLEQVDLIKIDVELHESAVFRGAVNTIEQMKPTIICEILRRSEGIDEIAEMLRGQGYMFYLMTNLGLKPSAEIAPSPVWMNYLFTTEDPRSHGLTVISATA